MWRVVAASIAIGLTFVGCSDPGYYFAESDARLDRIAPSVNAYCDNAMRCVPLVFRSHENCRWVCLSSFLYPTDDCDAFAKSFLDCGAAVDCAGVPMLVMNTLEAGDCYETAEAYGRCVGWNDDFVDGGDP